jgi:hypothetical protein
MKGVRGLRAGARREGMNSKLLQLICALLFVACVRGGQAEVMYARTSTSVREGRRLSSPVVGRLRQGESVAVLERAGRHYRVSVGEGNGWVYYNKLAEQKPEDVASLLASAPAAEGIELAELEAGGALRGLSPTTRDYAEAAGVPQWALEAVEQMQSLQISAEQLDAFAREGNLGEYGEGQ